MKPIKLIIEGVNSFTEPQELDFEAVGRGNLFCICGKTGAGKTTIFDSIMLALYGRSGKGNLADVVNLGRSQACVTFDFLENGETYRVERTIKCHVKKADKTDSEPVAGELLRRTAVSECTLYRGGIPIAKGEDATAMIENIVGLACSEFKNVYLLEQGDYAEFLKLTPAKQTETVGKIFSLTRFGEVYARANDRMKEADKNAEIARATMEALGDVTEKTVKEKKSFLASLKAKTSATSKEIERKRAELSEQEKKRDEYRAVIDKQKAVSEWAVKLETANTQKANAEKALCEFENTKTVDYDGELEKLRLKINELSVLAERDKECENAQNAVTSAENAFAQKKKECDDAIAKFNLLAEELEKVKTTFARKKDDAIVLVKKIDGGSALLQKIAIDLQSENVGESVLSKTYYETVNERNALNDLLSGVDKLDKEIEGYKNTSTLELEKLKAYAAEKEKEQANRSLREAELKKAEEELNASVLASRALAIASELHDGDTCPVCGGAYHGTHSDGGDMDEKKRLKDVATANLNECNNKLVELDKLLDGAKLRYDGAEKIVNERVKEREQKLAEIKKYGASVGEYDEIISTLEKLKELASDCDAKSRNCEKLCPSIEKLKAELDGTKTAFEEKKKNFDELKIKLGEYRGRASIELKAVREKTVELENAKLDRDKKLSELKQAVATATGLVSSATETLENARKQCPSELPEFDESAFVVAKEELERQTGALAMLTADVARAETELVSIEEKAKLRAEQQSKLNAAEKTADTYRELAEITKGKKMLDFVASEYIEDFTATASEILGELSNGKYSIRYDREGGFVVSDFLNDGIARKTDTLSGGEMFLTSLAVAIAIARAVSGGDNAFFFLDEGFGTLDEELIDTVYSALEGLSQSCLVGVISHSQPLIERMPSCVEVLEATGEIGSRIRY